MKLNKKLVVTSLSTVLGLGIVGSVTGAVAWYQYSTRASASVIGTSAGKSGLLQIKEKDAADTAYGRALYTKDLLDVDSPVKFYPVTFGGFAKNAALPTKAYTNPEAGYKEVDRADHEATEGKEYYQFTVSLRTMENGTQVGDKDVYLSDIVLEEIAEGSNPVTGIGSALRMHIACGSNYALVAPGTARNMDCHGNLDLDGQAGVDTAKNYEWDADTPIDYGMYNGGDSVDTTKQTTYTIAEACAERGTDGKLTTTGAFKVGTTSASASLDVTVTIWLEGWELISSSAVWDPTTIGKTIHAGLTFDIGSDAFNA